MLRINTEFLIYIDELYQSNRYDANLLNFDKDCLLLLHGRAWFGQAARATRKTKD